MILVHHAAHGLNTERKRSNIQQQQALNFAAENAGLNAAPIATHSSGLMPLNGSLPMKLLD